MGMVLVNRVRCVARKLRPETHVQFNVVVILPPCVASSWQCSLERLLAQLAETGCSPSAYPTAQPPHSNATPTLKRTNESVVLCAESCRLNEGQTIHCLFNAVRDGTVRFAMHRSFRCHCLLFRIDFEAVQHVRSSALCGNVIAKPHKSWSFRAIHWSCDAKR